MTAKYINYSNRIKITKHYNKIDVFSSIKMILKILVGEMVIAVTLLATLGYSDIYIKIIEPFVEFAGQFSLSNIVVQGNETLSKDTILQCANVAFGSSSFDVNVHKIKKHLEEICFGIKRVEVSLLIPKTLLIKVEERIPKAIWRHQGSFVLIDNEGYKIRESVTNEEKAKYVIIFGERAHVKFTEILDVLRMYSIYYHQIASLHLVQDRRWDVFLSNGTMIKLPENNVITAVKLLNKLSAVNNEVMTARVIDLRLSPQKVFIKPL
ncbi:cell division protein FtsQ [Alphaproteobacteria bacterium]